MRVIVDFCTFWVLVNFYANLASTYDKVKAQYLICLVLINLVFITQFLSSQMMCHVELET